MTNTSSRDLVDNVANDLIGQMERGRGQVNDLCCASLWGAAGAVIAILESEEESLGELREAWGDGSRRKAEALIALWAGVIIAATLTNWEREKVDLVITGFVDDMFDGIGEQITQYVNLILAQDHDDLLGREVVASEGAGGFYTPRAGNVINAASLALLGRDPELLHFGTPPLPHTLSWAALIDRGARLLSLPGDIVVMSLRSEARRWTDEYRAEL